MFACPRRVAAMVALSATVALAACSPTDPSAEDPAPGSSPTAPVTREPTAEPPPAGTPPVEADEAVEVIAVTVSDGQVQPAAGRVDVALGTVVRIQVSADVTDEVHVHGYELLAPVTPTTPAVIEFSADIPGVFEVEVEGSGLELVQLRVS